MSVLLSAVALPALSIPSPSVSYLQLGPFRVHFYALCILTGMAGCLWLGGRPGNPTGGPFILPTKSQQRTICADQTQF